MRITVEQQRTMAQGIKAYVHALKVNGYDTTQALDKFFCWMKAVEASRLQDKDYPFHLKGMTTETGSRVFPYTPDADVYFNDRSLNDKHLNTALKRITL